MARSRKNSTKVWSTTSDEQLALIIAKEYAQSPSEFSIHTTDEIGKNFVAETSARGIDCMKKWL